LLFLVTEENTTCRV